MKKIKNFYRSLVDSVPERAFLEINKQLITAFAIYIMLAVIIIFLKFWMGLLIITVVNMLYIGLLVYEMILFKNAKMRELQGICTEYGHELVPSPRFFIFLDCGEEKQYKIYLPKRKVIKEGSEITSYVHLSKIQEYEAYNHVSNALMIFVTKIGKNVEKKP